MEVWALEAYGAAYVLQEMLTVKSDDVKAVPRCTKHRQGRARHRRRHAGIVQRAGQGNPFAGPGLERFLRKERDMKSLLDLFKQFTPDEHFDAIKIGWPRPRRSVRGLSAK
jgi:hypothetical protein